MTFVLWQTEKRHIPIIDDNEDIVNMMRLMLQMKNYDVSAK